MTTETKPPNLSDTGWMKWAHLTSSNRCTIVANLMHDFIRNNPSKDIVVTHTYVDCESSIKGETK